MCCSFICQYFFMSTLIPVGRFTVGPTVRMVLYELCLAFLEDLSTFVRMTSLHSGVYNPLSNLEKVILCLYTVVLYYYCCFPEN